MSVLANDIKYLYGVGEFRARLLNKLGIHTVEDMLYFFPRFVEDRSKFSNIRDMQDGENICIRGVVEIPAQVKKIRNNLTLYTILIRDGIDTATVTWFNNKFVKDIFKVGQSYDFYGRATVAFGKRELSNPTYEIADHNIHVGRVVPIYPLTDRLPQKTIRAIAKNCIDVARGSIVEYLPEYILEQHRLPSLKFALCSIHFPLNLEDYNISKHRLAFEELLILKLGLMRMRNLREKLEAHKLKMFEYKDEFFSLIPFSLTNAQKKVIDEIFKDMTHDKPMSRLVQGDVGSGKTVVAFAAMYAAVKNGMQVTLMAPTEVLAGQHFESAKLYFKEEDMALLTGSVTAASKKKIYEKISSGEAKVVIGTHALIENKVEFNRLGLVVTDEQHRFGVKQRALLAQKGMSPHALVMSATPIPRTLALIIYGDLDISIVNEIPPGRIPVDTYVVGEAMRKRIYDFCRKHIALGRQIYIVCPLVEESEKMDLMAATGLKDFLQEKEFADYRVELLYGKMKAKEKNRIMDEFTKGKINILVSTTVIEVGINVPNACVMIIENAERFGLSQLHQIRGRVGRGKDKSYCILFSENRGGARERLDIMVKTNDGFEIAKKDLDIRGPGDFLGTRQHGLPELKIANLFTDMELLGVATTTAKSIMTLDPYLINENHILLRERLDKVFENIINDGIIS